eukprot:g4944.t1
MSDERFVTSLLRRFSDHENGWISVRNSGSVILLTEFIRLFESFIREMEPQAPRRLRQIPWLRRTVVRCLDGWNILRNQDAQTTEDIATVELVGDHLTNVNVVRRSLRNRTIRRRVPSRGKLPRRNFQRGDTDPFQHRPKEPIQRRDDVPMKGEVSVRNEIAGAIIGRRGKTISTIRSESGSHVHVCECKDGWSRSIEIYGSKKQVLDAYHQLNAVIRREHPNYLKPREFVEMITTIELKMGIALATYLTGINGSLVTDVQEKTGVVTTLHGVDGEEDSKKVRLTGNMNRILDAYHAVMAILDTYEEWRASNLPNDHDQGLHQDSRAQVMSMGSHPGENGEVIQTSSVIVLQPDGSYKEMQIWMPSPLQLQQNTSPVLTNNALSPPSLMNGGRELSNSTQNQIPHLYPTPAAPNQSSTTLLNPLPPPPPIQNESLFGKVSVPFIGGSQQQQQQHYHHHHHQNHHPYITGVEDPAGRLVSLLQNHTTTRPGLMPGQETGFNYQSSLANHPSTGLHTSVNVSSAVNGGYSSMHHPDQGQVIILPAEQTAAAAHSIVYNNDELQNTVVASQSLLSTQMTHLR